MEEDALARIDMYTKYFKIIRKYINYCVYEIYWFMYCMYVPSLSMYGMYCMYALYVQYLFLHACCMYVCMCSSVSSIIVPDLINLPSARRIKVYVCIYVCMFLMYNCCYVNLCMYVRSNDIILWGLVCIVSDSEKIIFHNQRRFVPRRWATRW